MLTFLTQLPLPLQAPETFWPNEAGSWFALIASALAVIVTMVTFIYRTGRMQQSFEDRITTLATRMEERFKDQGHRVGSTESHCSSHAASIEELRRFDTTHTLQIDTNSRELGSLRGELDKLERTLHELQSRVHSGDGNAKERLTAIETRIKFFDRLEDALLGYLPRESPRKRGG